MDIDYEALSREIQEQIEWDKSYWWGDDEDDRADTPLRRSPKDR